MNSLINKNLIPALLCLIFVAACSDNSTGSGDEVTSVEGLWKLRSTEGDISYVDFTSTVVTDYDFQGDAYDEGEDCYLITTLQIVNVNGDTYTFADPIAPGNTVDMKIISRNDVLTVEQPTGNGSIIVKFDRFNGNVSELTPECVEEVGTGKAKALGFK